MPIYGQPSKYTMDQWRFICFHSEELDKAAIARRQKKAEPWIDVAEFMKP